MPIKRVTIELDDTIDSRSPTTVPPSLTTKQSKPRDKTTDGIPKYEEETETESESESESAQRSSGKTINTGRTFPDLISGFIGNPRAMATILMFIPFPFFASTIKDIDSLKYPIIVGVLLNLVWFTVPLLIKLFGQVSNEK